VKEEELDEREYELEVKEEELNEHEYEMEDERVEMEEEREAIEGERYEALKAIDEASKLDTYTAMFPIK